MSGAYAKEFEKWLEGKRTENPNNAEFDDPDMIHRSDSDDEVDNLSGHGSLSSLDNQGISVETAPILTDDEDSNDEYDDDIQTGINPRYEEPPILEPVPSMPNQKQSLKSSSLDEAPYSHFKHSHKGVTRKKSKSKECSDLKNRNWKERDNCELGKEGSFYPDGTNTGDEYSKHSGNIFDKFNSISEQTDDVPPPLIPSPGADAPSPNGSDNDCSSANLPNNSPDFCAMEADSTSEMLKSNAQEHCSGKKEKSVMMNSQGDVSIECDSTCMLGVSPNVLSPEVFSNTDNLEDCGNQSDSHFVSREPTNGISEELFPLSRMNESLFTHSSGTEAKEGDKINKSGSWDQECPTLEVAVTLEEKKENESHQDIPTEEPPVLSVIMPESYHALRRKRHTIDTVENIGSTAKRKHTVSASPIRSERQVETDSLEPPNLARQPETKNVMCSQDRINKHRKSSARKHSVCSKKSHRSKNERRNRSYSLVDMNKFVKRASQLSHLQSRMHKLISLLFPQIKSDMETMSPESIHFENVLVDLASPKQEPIEDAIDNNVMCCVQTSENNVDGSENFSQCALNSSEDDFSNSLQLSNSSFAASLNHTDTNLISSGHSTGSYLTPGSQKDTGSSEDLSNSEFMIPKLSQLTLTSEKEKIMQRQPSVVIKANACEALKSFSGLTCNVLQLLLPDLSINLFDALGDSYHDLLNLIDSVILLNSG